MSTGSRILLGIAIALAAIFFNGIVATVEDELPGGFLNPRGDGSLSPFSRRWLRIGRIVFLSACVPLVVVALWGIRAIIADWRPADRALDVGFVAGAALLATAILWRRRALLWLAAGMIGIGMAAALVLR